ncbi:MULTISPECIES: hypothetical protein [Breznakia]|uniref:Lipoprotein n=1 Tax=Breznakia blatticola TaxID=1754012 RepID=A0A4R7ZSP5_9FIRM|nr:MULTISPECIES: hypothetical protein [Breznakia]MDH6367017.1 uncharacterized lipoprotein YehR (DUF1307 family) [Breznakia sp. PH1-1]MDH6404211.1 uncharacterized lipoprotein YehR (DUF1307 family) [Breznakia sp. PF1-11]MDH6411904.1 uncharacterized lipoprotein YehR (DUF1307 family) [Breznakia sp. PFB1-11]MDH6414199.1 uncharacterized lipoprotein YehR (DUF1307 family) [Breznakia sp. PFB1-14]MDH6415977.1 uncharacterized lipoprotein YehR (DUF1307 family) [Breznakia sp. PFB1-4]
MKKLLVIIAMCLMMVACDSDESEMVCTYKKDDDKGKIVVRYEDDKIHYLHFSSEQYIEDDVLDEVGEKDFADYWKQNVESFHKEGISAEGTYDGKTRMGYIELELNLDQLKERNYSDFYLTENLSLKSFKKRVEDQLDYTCK